MGSETNTRSGQGKEGGVGFDAFPLIYIYSISILLLITLCYSMP